MPYITKERREGLVSPGNAGELNYILSNSINNYIVRKGLSYETINACIGALECAKLEVYRRVAADYEDKKKNENGDVYL
jgi:hypothetical protein